MTTYLGKPSGRLGAEAQLSLYRRARWAPASPKFPELGLTCRASQVLPNSCLVTRESSIFPPPGASIAHISVLGLFPYFIPCPCTHDGCCLSYQNCARNRALISTTASTNSERALGVLHACPLEEPVEAAEVDTAVGEGVGGVYVLPGSVVPKVLVIRPLLSEVLLVPALMLTLPHISFE